MVVLGKGSQAKVYSAIEASLGILVAVKLFDKRLVDGRFQKNLIQTELNILIKSDHPNIVTLFNVIEDRTNICLVMEY
jgi:serine/threonine protein kinase